MANLQIVDAVKEVTDRFLANQGTMWNLLRGRVAEELAPLLAELVRQELIHQLAEPTPDARVERLQEAVAVAWQWWTERGREPANYDDYAEEVFGELTKAAEAVPVATPCQLSLHLEGNARGVLLDNAARVALSTLEGLKGNPLILDAELVYPIEQLRKALGEVGHA